jgi:hypothetical protein
VRSWIFRHKGRLLALLGKPAPAPAALPAPEVAALPRVVTVVPARRAPRGW